MATNEKNPLAKIQILLVFGQQTTAKFEPCSCSFAVCYEFKTILIASKLHYEKKCTTIWAAGECKQLLMKPNAVTISSKITKRVYYKIIFVSILVSDFQSSNIFKNKNIDPKLLMLIGLTFGCKPAGTLQVCGQGSFYLCYFLTVLFHTFFHASDNSRTDLCKMCRYCT